MKEHKVVQFIGGLTKNTQRLENVLNEHAKNGWEYKQFLENTGRIIMERTKNR